MPKLRIGRGTPEIRRHPVIESVGWKDKSLYYSQILLDARKFPIMNHSKNTTGYYDNSDRCLKK